MWLAEAAVDPNSGSLWIALAALFTALGGVLVALITTRRSRGSHRTEVRKGQDEAVREYRKTFAEPLRRENETLRQENEDLRNGTELARERERRIAAEAESDGHRARWIECERKHAGHAHD